MNPLLKKLQIQKHNGEVAQENLDKLAARKKEGTIDGNGDGITKAERGK